MYKILICILICSISFNTFSALCTNWSPSRQLGELNSQIIDEASGLAVSTIFENRLYHINDSGDGPYFYQTDMDGSSVVKVKIKGFTPLDVEDLAYGKFDNRQALYIGDIGDNRESREYISIIIIEERKKFSKPVVPIKTINVRYPDRAHNAEGMAIHPNGDIYILTKEVDHVNRRAMPAQLFRISKEMIQSANSELFNMEYVASFEISFILDDYSQRGRIVTSFDISPNGSKFLIMTYKAVVEVAIDLSILKPLSTRQWKENVHYTIFETERLPKQEAVSYLPRGQGFIYTTEYHDDFGSTPIFQVNCL